MCNYSYIMVLQNVTASLNQMFYVDLWNNINIQEIITSGFLSIFTISKGNEYIGIGPRNVLTSARRKSHIEAISKANCRKRFI